MNSASHWIYLGSSSVIETSFGDIGDLSVEWLAPRNGSEYESELTLLFWMQNAGLDGACKDTVLLLSITFTIDIIGLSVGSSWTHRSPMWTHFKIWSPGQCPAMDESASSTAVPANQCSHTCIFLIGKCSDINTTHYLGVEFVIADLSWGTHQT